MVWHFSLSHTLSSPNFLPSFWKTHSYILHQATITLPLYTLEFGPFVCNKIVLITIMASHSYSNSLLSTILVVLSMIILLLQFIFPTCTASEINLQQSPSRPGFRFALQHIDSSKNLTKIERIRNTLKREKQRRQSLIDLSLAAALSGNQITSQIQPTITGVLYVMQVAIGTPPLNYYAAISTGSDLIWAQCKSCKKCFNQSTPLFDPKMSSSFSDLSCTSQLCKALPSSNCSTNGCKYEYAYNSYTYTRGVMATETFTFSENVKVSDLAFGCGEDNRVAVQDGFAGVMGMGRGPLSLVSQLHESIFSYCLPSFDDDKTKTSTLFIGSIANIPTNNALVKTTPLIKNKIYPSLFYISLHGISVGNVRVNIDPEYFAIYEESGSGGVVIDPSTEPTILQEDAFDAMAELFASQMNANIDDWSSSYDACFVFRDNKTKVKVPNLVFHFKNADLEVDNYMIMDPVTGKLCLTIARAFEDRSVIGNMQQRNMLVSYDLRKETLSFLPTRCDQI